MDLLYNKALHIIFIVTWFAGLFYVVRLFIYYAEADQKAAPEKSILQKQFQLMTKRLWLIITWPSAILASIFAFWMLYQNPAYLELPWMHIKLGFVALLYAYHIGCHLIYRQQQNGIVKYSGAQLRVWNELATLILVAVVFIVVLKSTINWIYGVIGLVLFALILMLSIRLYKSLRKTNNWE